MLAKPISNVVDPEGIAQERLISNRSVVAVGDPQDVNALLPSNTTKVELSEVQFNASGIYEADLSVKSEDDSMGAINRCTFKCLPIGVTV